MTHHLPPRPPGQPMEPFRPVEPESFTPSEYDVLAAPTVRTGGGATSSSNRLMNIALAIAVLVGAVGVAFAVGRATSPVTTPVANTTPQGPGAGVPNGNGAGPGASLDPNGQPGGQPGPSFGPNGRPGGVPGDDNGGFGRGPGRGGLSMEGTVQSATATSVTITLANGQTVTLPIDAATTFHQQSAATQADVTAGKKVLVRITGGFGDDNQGGSGPSVGDITLVP